MIRLLHWQRAALKAASKGTTTSIDLNYRKNFGRKEKAHEVSKQAILDVCIGNEEDDTTLGFKAAHTDVTKGELNLDGYKDVFKQMKEKFGFKFIASLYVKVTVPAIMAGVHWYMTAQISIIPKIQCSYC